MSCAGPAEPFSVRITTHGSLRQGAKCGDRSATELAALRLLRLTGELVHPRGQSHRFDASSLEDRVQVLAEYAGPIMNGRISKLRRGVCHPFRRLTVSGLRYFKAGGDQGLTLSGAGKFSGTFWVTRPVAAHSVPRSSVTTKPTSSIDSSLWPSVLWNTRPRP